jgi:hypothetical protein
MRGFGIAVQLKKRPIVRFVCLEGDASSPGVVRQDSHTSRQDDVIAQQLRKIADDLDSLLGVLEPEAVVVRAPDYYQFGPKREVLRSKSLVDGVLLETAKRRVTHVDTLNGREIGLRIGASKEESEARAVALVGDDDYKEAGAAALAALAWLAEL